MIFAMIAGIAASLHVVRAGTGPRGLLIHGSAADHSTWSIQLARAGRGELPLELVAYDRRRDAVTVADHAADAASLLDTPAVIAGSSFGAVVALELVRARPDLVTSAVLIEPPMAADDSTSPAPVAFLGEFDRIAASDGGPAAAEFFLRTVLGDAVFESMPRAFADRAKSKWADIRADSAALIAYQPRYAELARVTTPVTLVGGERSPEYVGKTLAALEAALPNTTVVVVPGAGHMLHAEAPKRFAEVLLAATRDAR
jgi:pimeloyl-ACP methyl ester carboxylesterase